MFTKTSALFGFLPCWRKDLVKFAKTVFVNAQCKPRTRVCKPTLYVYQLQAQPQTSRQFLHASPWWLRLFLFTLTSTVEYSCDLKKPKWGFAADHKWRSNAPIKKFSIISKNTGLSRRRDFPVDGTFPWTGLSPIQLRFLFIYASCLAIIRTDAVHHLPDCSILTFRILLFS